MINVNALRIAIRARLVGNAPLAAALETVNGEAAVFSGVIPATVTWTTLPVIEYGIQAHDRDIEANGYVQDGSDIRLRLMAHMRGPAPGVGTFDPLFAALALANTALTATKLSVGGQNVWDLRWMGGIPEVAPADAEGYLRLQAGDIYRVRSHT